MPNPVPRQKVTPSRVAPDDLGPLIEDWRRSLMAQKKAAGTLRNYIGCVTRMLEFLASKDMPRTASTVAREHLEAFIVDRLENVSDATAAKHYRAMKIFFSWLEEDGEITVSPMAKMKPPKIAEKTVPNIETEDINKLLATCNGQGFYDRRDKAIITLLYDSGARISEITGMSLDDYEPDLRRILVTGKGSRDRHINVGAKSQDALRRYLRVRRTHPTADTTDAFWLGRYRPIGRPGVAQMLDRRCAEAGIPHVHPHQFRHTFAHNWLAGGGNETDLMSLAGWKSREMISRYARSAASERARSAHQSLSPADRLLK